MQLPSFVVRDSLNRPRHPRHTGRCLAAQVERRVEGEVVLGVAAVPSGEGAEPRLVVLDGPGHPGKEQTVEAA